MRETVPVTWSDEKLILLYCPGRGLNSRPPAHRGVDMIKVSYALTTRPRRRLATKYYQRQKEKREENTIYRPIHLFTGSARLWIRSKPDQPDCMLRP